MLEDFVSTQHSRISAMQCNHCLSLGLNKTDYEMTVQVIPHSHSVQEI